MLQLVRSTVIFVCVAVLFGCGSSDNDSVSLRMFHAQPSTGNVDVLVNQQMLFRSVAYAGLTSTTADSSGTKTFTTERSSDAAKILENTYNLKGAYNYTYILTGLSNSVTDMLLEFSGRPADFTKTEVRVAHAAPRTLRLDFYFTDLETDLAEESPDISSVAFGEQSPYLELPEGTYRIRGTLAGTRVVVVDIAAADLEMRTVHSLVVYDAESGSAATARATLLRDY